MRNGLGNEISPHKASFTANQQSDLGIRASNIMLKNQGYMVSTKYHIVVRLHSSDLERMVRNR